MFVRKIYIIFIFFILTFSLKSNELKEYKIVLVDILKDIRYSNWGVHPVDIRSKYNKEKRPIAGAKLAIEDSKMIQRLTKTKFILDYLRFNDQKDFLAFLLAGSPLLPALPAAAGRLALGAIPLPPTILQNQTFTQKHFLDAL